MYSLNGVHYMYVPVKEVVTREYRHAHAVNADASGLANILWVDTGSECALTTWHVERAGRDLARSPLARRGQGRCSASANVNLDARKHQNGILELNRSQAKPDSNTKS